MFFPSPVTLDPPGPLQKHRFFFSKILCLRTWVRERKEKKRKEKKREEKRRKERRDKKGREGKGREGKGRERSKKKERRENAPTETGPFPQSHAKDLFVIRVRGNPSRRCLRTILGSHVAAFEFHAEVSVGGSDGVPTSAHLEFELATVSAKCLWATARWPGGDIT